MVLDPMVRLSTKVQVLNGHPPNGGPPQGMSGAGKPEPFHAEVTFDWTEPKSCME